MNTKQYVVRRYDADPGKVFDWAQLTDHMIENEDGSITYNHLYAKTIFLSDNDSIDNYEEIDASVMEEG